MFLHFVKLEMSFVFHNSILRFSLFTLILTFDFYIFKYFYNNFLIIRKLLYCEKIVKVLQILSINS